MPDLETIKLFILFLIGFTGGVVLVSAAFAPFLSGKREPPTPRR